MAYQLPGAYLTETIASNGSNITGLPFGLCIVATGSRLKRVSNEGVIRGEVSNEALTVSGSSPYVATLANRAVKSVATTVLNRVLNGVSTQILSSYYSFNKPFVLGTVTSAVDLTTVGAANAFALEMDGIRAVTLVLTSTGATTAAGSPAFSAATFVGQEIHVTFTATTGSAVTAIPMADIAAAINFGLNAASALGFGTNYATAASTVAGALQITSPGIVSSSVQDVQVFDAFAHSGLTAIFGAAGASNRQAQSVITINNAVYNAGATWTASYAKCTGYTDALANINVQDLVSVGTSPGGTNFTQSVDYVLNGNLVDFSADTHATYTGIAGAAGGTAPDLLFNVGTNNQLIIGMDGLVSSLGSTTDVTITLSGSPSPSPLGYTTPATPTAAHATEIANNINAYLAAALGPRYAGAATVVAINGSNRIVLTSVAYGSAASLVYVSAPTSLSAVNTVFGAPTTTPAMGTGKRPSFGSTYYVTYDFTRPTSDYNVPMQFYSLADALAQVGNPSPSVASYNPLAIGAGIAFQNGVNYLYTVQINDTLVGAPTRVQIQAALAGAATQVGCTEIVVLDAPGTTLTTAVDLIAHLEQENASLEQHPRRGFFGMPTNTPIGDADTLNSFVGRATQTLQVAPNSPARGRMFLACPPQQAGLSDTITFSDGTSARIQLDSSYLALAIAAARTALQSPADTLTRQDIFGFNVDDITKPWAPAELRALAGNGVFVAQFSGGNLVCTDACSTERGGGGLLEFTTDSTSYQKDTVTTALIQAINDNLIGLVPSDVASFITFAKLTVANVLAQAISNGSIGPYTDASGNVRSVNPKTDIQIVQSVSDPTKYNLNYWYKLRYPALVINGIFSVDNPFFSTGSA